MTTTSTVDSVIEAHPQAQRIRRVLSTAYRAFSYRYKTGLDAVSFLLGPAAPIGFSMVMDHRDAQRRQFTEALQDLLPNLGDSATDRRIIAILLADYPGRDSWAVEQLRSKMKVSTPGSC